MTEPAPPPARTPVHAALERSRYLVAIGSFTSLLLALCSFGWAAVKAASFTATLVTAPRNDDDKALVKVFESIDTVLIGTVLLIIGLGLWELFVSDLSLPPALTVATFADLKAKVATTLLLVLVVRFLETTVRATDAEQVLQLGAAVTLVGGLLLAFSVWKR